jgi:hypothetical protein
MTQMIPLSKRTKQEILDEYAKIQDQLDELHDTAKVTHSQPALDLVEKAKSRTPQSIDALFADFQASLQSHAMELRASLLGQLTALEEIQKAITLSKQQLEFQHHISVAADSLDRLVEEQTQSASAFEETMLQKKREWKREAEEYEYQQKLKRERDQAESEEREKAWVIRENTIRAQEQEIVQMKKAIEQFPKELENAQGKGEQFVRESLTQKFEHEKALHEKETNAQIRLLELTVKNLEDRLAVQANDLATLKQQADEANAKAQTLAMKAIERPTTIVTPMNQASSAHQNS